MKLEKMKSKVTQVFKVIFGTGIVMLTSSVPVMADTVQDSKLVKGTENLIQDVTTWLMVLAPIVGVLLIIYFFIRRSAADEIDQEEMEQPNCNRHCICHWCCISIGNS